MKLNKNIRFFREPYADCERYWLVNIENGDVFKISKKSYSLLARMQRTNGFFGEKEDFAELEAAGIFQDDN
jgi:hypothetical protein